jgi:hypothetical protein
MKPKPCENGLGGRNRLDFWTVRPGFKSRAPDQFLNWAAINVIYLVGRISAMLVVVGRLVSDS